MKEFRQKRLTHSQRVEIFKRLKAGEKQNPLAAEYGVTRQAISLIANRDPDWDSNGFKARKTGRPRLQGLKDEHREFLRHVVHNQTPAEAGLKGFAGWTMKAARELLRTKYQVHFSHTQVLAALKSWDKLHMPMPMEEDLGFGQDYYDYVNSPIGQEIRRREQEWIRKEKERTEKEGPPQRRRGRPPKNPAPGAGLSADSSIWKSEVITAEDIEKRLAAFHDQQMVREVQDRYLAGQPGHRLGKHGKNRGERHHRKKKRR